MTWPVGLVSWVSCPWPSIWTRDGGAGGRGSGVSVRLSRGGRGGGGRGAASRPRGGGQLDAGQVVGGGVVEELGLVAPGVGNAAELLVGRLVREAGLEDGVRRAGGGHAAQRQEVAPGQEVLVGAVVDAFDGVARGEDGLGAPLLVAIRVGGGVAGPGGLLLGRPHAAGHDGAGGDLAIGGGEDPLGTVAVGHGGVGVVVGDLGHGAVAEALLDDAPRGIEGVGEAGDRGGALRGGLTRGRDHRADVVREVRVLVAVGGLGPLGVGRGGGAGDRDEATPDVVFVAPFAPGPVLEGGEAAAGGVVLEGDFASGGIADPLEAELAGEHAVLDIDEEAGAAGDGQALRAVVEGDFVLVAVADFAETPVEIKHVLGAVREGLGPGAVFVLGEGGEDAGRGVPAAGGLVPGEEVAPAVAPGEEHVAVAELAQSPIEAHVPAGPEESLVFPARAVGALEAEEEPPAAPQHGLGGGEVAGLDDVLAGGEQDGVGAAGVVAGVVVAAARVIVGRLVRVRRDAAAEGRVVGAGGGCGPGGSGEEQAERRGAAEQSFAERVSFHRRFPPVPAGAAGRVFEYS